MFRLQRIVRRLLLEQLSERIAFHAEELTHEDMPLYTPDGFAYFYDPLIEFATDEQVGGDGDVRPESVLPAGTDNGFHVMDGPANLNVPLYHSNPSFPKKLYLDFDGHVATGTNWNNQTYITGVNTGATITAPAYSADADRTTFNTSELAQIQEIWARASEDYAPFQVDVTTEEPPASLFTAGSQAMRVVITTDVDAVTGTQWYPTAGGVAYLNSWTLRNATPAWVFANHLANFAKYIGEAVSHEAGHTFNLGHDGRISPAEGYYQGHGSGATGWAPIMGVGYYRSLSQWSKGEYTSANNTQDDLAVITGKIPYLTDDYGNTVAAATQLNVGTASTIAASGLITTRTDVDAIRFATQAGSITLNVSPFDMSTGKNNLDAKLSLLDDSGATVAAVDNVSTVNSTLTISVAKGFYTLVVDGAARPAVTGDEGYSDYASIGKYSVSGTIVPNAAPTVVNDSATVLPQGSLLIDALANDLDANNDLLTISSIGSPLMGTAAIEAGKIRYTAGLSRGTVAIPYTVVDELGVSSSGTVVVMVNTPPTDIALSSSSVVENLFGGAIGTVTVTDPDAGDTQEFSVDDGRFEVVGGMLKLKTGSSLNYETSSSVSINVTVKDAANAQFSKAFTISVTDLPELASSGGMIVGDGTVQRSSVRNLSVTFDGEVTIASGAFSVTKRGTDGGAVTTAATPALNGTGQTVVVLTFSGQFTRGTSGALSDGYYQLTIDGSLITRNGQQLDINGDGQTGDTFTLGASEADNFFALYGDTSGDGVVGVTEFGQFRNAFGKSTGQLGYDDLFDYEGDGVVGISDFGQFRNRFGKAKQLFQ